MRRRIQRIDQELFFLKEYFPQMTDSSLTSLVYLYLKESCPKAAKAYKKHTSIVEAEETAVPAIKLEAVFEQWYDRSLFLQRLGKSIKTIAQVILHHPVILRVVALPTRAPPLTVLTLNQKRKR